MSLLLSSGTSGPWSGRQSFSLNTKICAAATALVVASLAITATVIGFRSSATAESATMELARTSAREAAGSVQSRIKANLYSVIGLAGAMATTKAGNLPLLRPQIDAMVKSTLVSSPDFVGAAVTWFCGRGSHLGAQCPRWQRR